MITASELAALRDVAGEWLPDTCDIYAVTSGKDAAYGPSRGPQATARATNVPCRLTVTSGGSERTLATDQRGVFTVYTLTLPYDETILPTDTVNHAGTVYEVFSIDPDESTRTVRRVLVRRRD